MPSIVDVWSVAVLPWQLTEYCIPNNVESHFYQVTKYNSMTSLLFIYSPSFLHKKLLSGMYMVFNKVILCRSFWNEQNKTLHVYTSISVVRV